MKNSNKKSTKKEAKWGLLRAPDEYKKLIKKLATLARAGDGEAIAELDWLNSYFLGEKQGQFDGNVEFTTSQKREIWRDQKKRQKRTDALDQPTVGLEVLEFGPGRLINIYKVESDAQPLPVKRFSKKEREALAKKMGLPVAKSKKILK